jgi:hypothetical protein
MRRVISTGLLFTMTLGTLPLAAQTVTPPKAPATTKKPAARASLDQSLQGEARSEYDSAILLYEDGDFQNASLKFQRAYALSNDPRLLWNAAAAEKQLRHYPRMYILVSRYLREAAATLTQQEKADATALLQTVESFVSHLTVNVTPPGAELFIDEVAITKLPTNEPILADMGPRRFRIHKDGYKDFVLEREVIGGSPLTIEAALEVDLREGTLRVTAAPNDLIRIDGRLVGTGEWQGNLPSGVHSLSVTGAQKKPYQTDVAIETGQLTTHRVSLEPLATGERAPFATWPWVAGGVALVAIAGIGAYFAFKPGDPSAPATSQGTIAPGAFSF